MSWEGWSSGTLSAAAGGVTFIADMPSHGHPSPITTPPHLRSKFNTAVDNIHVDVGCYCLATPTSIHSDTVTRCLAAGAIGVAAFLTSQDSQTRSLTARDWSTLLNQLHATTASSYSTAGVPLLLSPILMTADRLAIVDPYCRSNSPYVRLAAPHDFDIARGIDINYGCQSQGSSVNVSRDASPRDSPISTPLWAEKANKETPNPTTKRTRRDSAESGSPELPFPVYMQPGGFRVYRRSAVDNEEVFLTDAAMAVDINASVPRILPLVTSSLNSSRLVPLALAIGLPTKSNLSILIDDARAAPSPMIKQGASYTSETTFLEKPPPPTEQASPSHATKLQPWEELQSNQSEWDDQAAATIYDDDFNVGDGNRAHSPARGLSTSVKETLLAVEKNSYHYTTTLAPAKKAAAPTKAEPFMGNWSESTAASPATRRKLRASSLEESEFARQFNVKGVSPVQTSKVSFEAREGAGEGGVTTRKAHASAEDVPSWEMEEGFKGKDRKMRNSWGMCDASEWCNKYDLASSLSSMIMTELGREEPKVEHVEKAKAKTKKRPPPIKATKESDSLTMVAMRREYSLFLHDFPSTAESTGISSVLSYRYDEAVERVERADGGGGRVKVHLFNTSSQTGCSLLRKGMEGIAEERSKDKAERELVEVEGRSRSSSKESAIGAHWPSFADVSSSTSVFYLTHDSSKVEIGDTSLKTFPPIRRAVHRAALWDGLKQGVLSFVTSGHMPVDPALKLSREGDFYKAASGVSSIELLLPAFWTYCENVGMGVGCLPELMCSAPARFLGIAGRKGSLEVGKDADIVIWDPTQEFVVGKGGHTLQNKYGTSVYDGDTLKGVVKVAICRGHVVFDGKLDGQKRFGAPRGVLIGAGGIDVANVIH